MRDTLGRLVKNRTADEDLLKSVRSKSKEMKDRYEDIHSVDAKAKDILASVNQIRGLNVKLGSINEKKLSTYLR